MKALLNELTKWIANLLGDPNDSVEVPVMTFTPRF
jgi:hypothetical protein